MKKQNPYDSVNMVRTGKPILSKEQNPITKINNLYREVTENLVDSSNKILEIGKILSEEKGKIEHGKFTEWVETNLPFGIRQAQKYMKVFESIKNGTVLNANSNSLLTIDGLVKTLSKDPEDSLSQEKREPGKKERIEKLRREIESLETKLKAKRKELKELIG